MKSVISEIVNGVKEANEAVREAGAIVNPSNVQPYQTDMEVDNKEDQEVLNAISKLKGLRILAKEQTRDSRELYKEAMSMIPTKEYEELMTVRDKDKDMKFFIKESGGKISELVMVMGGNEEFMVLSLFGEIDLKQVSKIGQIS